MNKWIIIKDTNEPRTQYRVIRGMPGPILQSGEEYLGSKTQLHLALATVAHDIDTLPDPTHSVEIIIGSRR